MPTVAGHLQVVASGYRRDKPPPATAPVMAEHPSPNVLLRLGGATPMASSVVTPSSSDRAAVILAGFDSLPETEPLPSARICAESQIKNSRQSLLCREFFIWLSAQKKHLANRLLCREANKKLSAQKRTLAKDFFAKCNSFRSRQRNF
jgi:hypothetical protein